jgi:hypothetical protein
MITFAGRLLNDRPSNTLMKGGGQDWSTGVGDVDWPTGDVSRGSKNKIDAPQIKTQPFELQPKTGEGIDPHRQSFQIPSVSKKDPTPIGLTKKMLDTGRKEGFIVSQKNIDNIDNPDIPDNPGLLSRLMNPVRQNKSHRAQLRDEGLLMTLTNQISGQTSTSGQSQISGQTSEQPKAASNKPVSKEELDEYHRILKGNTKYKILHGQTFLSLITFTWVLNFLGMKTPALIWYYFWYYFWYFIYLVIIFSLLFALFNVCLIVWKIIQLCLDISRTVVGGISDTMQRAVDKAIIPGLKIDAKIFKFKTPDFKLLGFLQGPTNKVKDAYNKIPEKTIQVVMMILKAFFTGIIDGVKSSFYRTKAEIERKAEESNK